MCGGITINRVRVRPGDRTKYTTTEGPREGIWGLGAGNGAYNARVENLNTTWKKEKANRAFIKVDSFDEKGSTFRYPSEKGTLLAAMYDSEGDFVIITQDAIGEVKEVHHRMPILLTTLDELGAWLQEGELPRNNPEDVECLERGPALSQDRSWMTLK